MFGKGASILRAIKGDVKWLVGDTLLLLGSEPVRVTLELRRLAAGRRPGCGGTRVPLTAAGDGRRKRLRE